MTLILLELVVAADEQGGIGRRGELPWTLPRDLAFFKRITTEPSKLSRAPLGSASQPSGSASEAAPRGRRNAVIMGRKTWETIPARFRPLGGRINVVVTHNDAYELPDGVLRAASVTVAAELLAARNDVDRAFIIGGGEIYALALKAPECGRVFLTRVEGHFDCDAFFPRLGDDWRRMAASERHEENGVGYTFQTWERGSPSEAQR
ncbi:MAG: dihydrofolate reductase [Myxococcales bacterium]|nr:dihydrofolate reductase [Myxococcales bacterium]